MRRTRWDVPLDCQQSDLTGELVFEADSSLGMALQHVQETPAPPSQRTELPIPPDLEAVILGCLEKDPARRPQTALELDQLRASCEGVARWSPQQARDWWELDAPQPLHIAP